MKHLKRFNEELTNFNEELTNFSKIRKWPTYTGREDCDYYFVYDLNKNELGKYLNVWFQGQSVDRIEPKNRKRKEDKHIFQDEIITVKKTDEETSNHLYHRKYNPVAIRIKNSYKGDLYDMKAQIHSVDDSSYGIWWTNKPTEELKKIRKELMDWVSNKDVLNGEEFLSKCISLEADEETKDYN